MEPFDERMVQMRRKFPHVTHENSMVKMSHKPLPLRYSKMRSIILTKLLSQKSHIHEKADLINGYLRPASEQGPA